MTPQAGLPRPFFSAARRSASASAPPAGSGPLLGADDVIRPDAKVRLTDSEQAAIRLVRAGAVDGALMDLPTALNLTKDDQAVETVAKFDRTEDFGIVLPNGSVHSDNAQAVNQSLNAMRADGTLDDLEQRWLAPAFARDPNDLPVVQTP